MAGRSRKQKKLRSSSSSWSSESSHSMNGLHYGAKLPVKKAKKEFLANPIKGYLTKDDTNLESSSMGTTSRKRNPHPKNAKLEMVKDEPSSSEYNQDSAVLSKKRTTWGRRKRAERGRKRKENGPRQRKATILSWLIDRDVIQENAEVYVMEMETRKKQGKIKKEGILCSCCYNVSTVAEFYNHAGGTCSKPYDKIFIAETCSSLLTFPMVRGIAHFVFANSVIYDKLERGIIGIENELDRSYKWTLLQNTDDGSGINIEDHYQRTMCHSKLVVARRLMEDCFEQIIDRHTRIDVIKSVVYNCGSNFNRVNFRGFYTAILEKGEEIISAATIRIHGTKLAEMPFIATNKEYRRKGMCRKLMVAIESALCYLKVEKLVIPSVTERIGTWIEKYGFHLIKSPLPKEIKLHNTLMFHDSKRLQKDLLPSALARRYRANSRARETRSSAKKSEESRPFDLNVEASHQQDKDC
ncbi:hypothetical protein RND71_015832 [Anisodus tanguticus]|uniref:N-acetyltransferase domain-containing protein n=1 Tax=Anisodus tanguticus TaxID=243964 RepID=A0AAE1S7L0_9SOLA|nr:hypothetical protein RND71_015832 [Anisodus tanguticus]